MLSMKHTSKHSVWRLAAAGLATLLAGLAAAVFWILAQAQYTNDYCITLVEQPESANPEELGGRPAYIDGPYTTVCYDGHPTVETFDPLMVLGAVFLAAIVITIGICAFRWAWRPARR